MTGRAWQPYLAPNTADAGRTRSARAAKRTGGGARWCWTPAASGRAQQQPASGIGSVSPPSLIIV